MFRPDEAFRSAPIASVAEAISEAVCLDVPLRSIRLMKCEMPAFFSDSIESPPRRPI